MEKEYIGVVKTIATEIDINPNWIASIIQKESVWNPWVIRYEKDYNYLVDPKKFVDKIWNSYSTEYQAQKMSWGLGQVMGGLAREMGFKGLLPELLKPEINIRYVCMRVKKLTQRIEDVRDVFACYNGGLGALAKNASGLHFNEQYVIDCVHNLQFFKL